MKIFFTYTEQVEYSYQTTMCQYTKLSHEINKERSHVSHKNRCFKIFSLAQSLSVTLSLTLSLSLYISIYRKTSSAPIRMRILCALSCKLYSTFLLCVCVCANKCSVSTNSGERQRKPSLTTIYFLLSFIFHPPPLSFSFFYFISLARY